MSTLADNDRDGLPLRVAGEVEDVRPPSLVHAEWREAFPWLVQGTTTRGAHLEPYDLGLFSGGSPRASVQRRWAELGASSGMYRVIHARQVHGRVVRHHGRGRPPPAIQAGVEGARREPDGRIAEVELVEDCDGHFSTEPGSLLAVTVADCVPIFLVDPRRRLVGVLHAGWRGAAAGILEQGLATAVRAGADVSDLRVHLGPAICGDCYEVGPEVFVALDRPAPEGPAPIDLRVILFERTLARGLRAEHVTVSSRCTLCSGSGLFSHRGGDRQRQAGFIGIRP